ncbi:hypothetical protein AB0P19_02340 [Microbacterium oleivorans]|uniref:hypothetical protein n=1 Tax=Microbacterium oleivorans TaxID=273677 RepID=UPI00341846A1
MGIVYAAPAVAPEPRAAAEGRFMSWTGVNGDVFVLSADDSNPAMQRGVQGLHMPDIQVFESSTPLIHGSELDGYTILPRRVFWPLMFQADTAAQWRAEHAAFFDSFHPTVPGTWTVGEGDDARTLGLVGTFDGGHTFDLDPFYTGWANIGVELRATRPLWAGKEIRREYEAELEPDFIPTDPEDPTYHPTSVLGYTSARIGNPGNEAAYVAWEIDGPHPPGLIVGVESFVITIPFEIPEGSTFTLDTDPTSGYAALDGVDMSTQLGFQIFAPVPAGGDVRLVISTEGTGRVLAKLTPLYWRAY